MRMKGLRGTCGGAPGCCSPGARMNGELNGPSRRLLTQVRDLGQRQPVLDGLHYATHGLWIAGAALPYR
jgi:hypothetical protein